MRLLERARDGVLSTDLLACHRYANGLAAAARGAMSGAGGASARATSWRRRATRRRCSPRLPDVEDRDAADTGHAMMAERPGDVLDALRRISMTAVAHAI